jgi:hypothetical protein
MYTGCGCSGCVTFIIGIFTLLLLVKFGIPILLLILIILLLNRNSVTMEKIKSAFKKQEEFVSKPGQIYKECTYCQKKAERSANFCDSCGRPFE